MTTSMAIVLAMLIAGGVFADFYFSDGAVSLYLTQQFVELLDWMSFWS